MCSLKIQIAELIYSVMLIMSCFVSTSVLTEVCQVFESKFRLYFQNSDSKTWTWTHCTWVGSGWWDSTGSLVV